MPDALTSDLVIDKALKDVAVKVAKDRTIRLSGTLENATIRRAGMPDYENDASAYAGTAITIVGDDAKILNSTIIGFNQGVSSDYHHRLRMERVNIDCVNGVRVDNSYDVMYLREVHCWPFGTVWSSAPDIGWDEDFYCFRKGAAFSFNGVNDWGKLTDCFAFGYKVGYSINGPNSMVLTGCGADNVSRPSPSPQIMPGTIGFLIQGSSNQTTLSACQAAAQNNAYFVNLASPDQEVLIANSRSWYSVDGSNALAVVQGGCTAQSNVFTGNQGSGYGIINLGQGKVIAIGNRLKSHWTKDIHGATAVNMGNV